MSKHFKYTPLFVLFFVNFLVYIPVLLIFPGFVYDDFIVFGIIKSNITRLVSFNPHEIFSLFFRPISYFSFWLDYKLWGPQFLPMKFFSLGIHLVVLFIFYISLIKLGNIFKIKNNSFFIVSLLLIFSVHFDMFTWVSWISNRTELLGFVFYLLSFYFVLLFVEKKHIVYFVLSLVFYTISILAKQNGLHFPLVMLFFLFINYKYNFISFKLNNKGYVVLFAFLLVMTVFFISNLLFVSGSEFFFSSLWKKPFALIGTFIHIILPIYSQTIYNIFIVNKLPALFLLIFLLIVLIVFRKKIFWTGLFYGLIFIGIISIPRVFGPGSQRINSIYIFWIVIFLYFGLLQSRYQYKKLTLVIILIIFYSLSLIKFVDNYKIITIYQNNMKRLVNCIDNTKINYVLGATDTYLADYELYYYKNKDFGCQSNIKLSPYVYYSALLELDVNNFINKVVRTELNGRTIKLRSFKPLIYLETVKSDNHDCKIISTKPSPSGRGYSEITYELPKWLDLNKTKLIYFDGKDWKQLN